ncbi:sensor histidine kinase [Niabella ginsengisoli]|uniref:Histidine kinase n=1 Tax=Niabella ginsengisoli TaxID=522298 RepID=A0ABS9SP68_9BACT|nr:histidine kinase [Niabella ginsengisoli]MCH5600144.1 histidine kinase [Niabella ginsengisoli]
MVDSFSLRHTTLQSADSLLEISLTTHNSKSLSTLVYLVKNRNKKEERILIGGRYNKKIPINKELWKEPGDYKIEFIPYAIVKRSDRANKTGMYEQEFNDKKFTYHLTVLPEEKSKIELSNRLAMLIGVLITLLITAIILFIKYRNKRKFLEAKRNEELAKNRLESIRSQLNPHFIFNALSSIQNLLNTHENDKANAYLTKFSRLTRSILDDSSKEMITIDDEVKLLEDYLQMEQMRFGFQYNISFDENIDRHNAQIPPMLLQPLIENAVKHGSITKKQKGEIEVSLSKINNDLVLSVTDNGDGFDSGLNYSGHGLSLTKNRISLLNTIYNATPLLFNIESGKNGSVAKITLKNWLL